MALVVVSGVWAHFIDAIPSFLLEEISHWSTYIYSYHIQDTTDLKLKVDLNITQPHCYANLHSVYRSTDKHGKNRKNRNLKHGQITMYNLIWNFTKGFPL